MRRCSRLMYDALPMYDRYEHETDIQPGDRMTGWERMASLPIEAQKDFWESDALTSEVAEKLKTEDEYVDALVDALCALYEWTGTEWTEVDA